MSKILSSDDVREHQYLDEPECVFCGHYGPNDDPAEPCLTVLQLAKDVRELQDTAAAVAQRDLEAHVAAEEKLHELTRQISVKRRDQRDALLAAAKAALEKHQCGDSSCIFGRPSGMHTNGGCRTLSTPQTAKMALQVVVADLRAAITQASGGEEK